MRTKAAWLQNRRLFFCPFNPIFTAKTAFFETDRKVLNKARIKSRARLMLVTVFDSIRRYCVPSCYHIFSAESLFAMKSVRLIQLTDPHLLGDPTAELRGINPMRTLQQTFAHAGARFDAADAILLTGDLVHDDPAGYDNIVQTFGASRIPVYCLPGNHDLPEQMRVALARSPFQVGGTAVLGKWVIALLDSFLPNSARGRLGKDQLQQLDSMLTAHADKHALICLHHHPIKMNSVWLDTVGLEDSDDLRALLARHKNVRGITWGHVHQSLDLFAGGVRYMATPATCAQFKPHSVDFAMDDKPPGYRVFELMPDGAIATEVIWVENAAACNTPFPIAV